MSDLASETLMTRQRLLEAAGEIFAEQGFKHGTVRDICARADANVAAVKYHFGGKNELYTAAVLYAHSCARKFPIDYGIDGQMPPAQRLRAFIHAFLMGILDPGKPAWHGKLMAREMSEPTGVLDQIVAQGMRPRYEVLTGIVRSMAEAAMPARTVQLCVNSIVGQMLFYHFAKPVLARLQPEATFDIAALDELTGHITAFAAGAIKARAAEFENEKSQ
jgi:AcrR family transcriptional regulator